MTLPRKTRIGNSSLSSIAIVVTMMSVSIASAVAIQLILPDVMSYWRRMPIAFSVLVYTTTGALASGLGCLPLLLFPAMTSGAYGVTGAVTTGAMSIASVDMFIEGLQCNVGWASVLCIAGVLIGMTTVAALNAILHLSVVDLQGADRRRILLVLSVMTLHSVAEGMGIGVSFSDQAAAGLGRFIAIAIGLHNIAEGSIIGLIMVSRGTTPARAIFYAILSSMPQPLVALPSFLLVQDLSVLLPLGLGVAAGAMAFLTVTEVGPEARSRVGSGPQFTAMVLSSAALMGSLRWVIAAIDQHL